MHGSCRSTRGRRPVLPGPALLLALSTLVPHARAEDPPPPNFVFILADDLGYGDLGCQGNAKVQTPRIDRMAKEGLRLTSYYTATVCAPARAALLTGRYPFRCGMPRNLDVGTRSGLAPREHTVAGYLKRKGYATALLGKWHLGELPHHQPADFGFGTFFGTLRSNSMRAPWKAVKQPPELLRDGEVVGALDDEFNAHSTQRLTEEAVAFIRAHREEPFFLFVSHYMPHLPLGTAEPFLGHSKAGLYGDVVETLDWSTGEILDALAACGLDERTLVVFTSDNGGTFGVPEKERVGGVEEGHHGTNRPLRGGKGSALEGGARVPCILRWPQRIPAERVSDAVTCMVDFFPTLLGYAGVTARDDRVIDGLDLRAFLEGKADCPRQEFQYWVRTELQGLRVGDWKVRLIVDDERMGLFNLAKDPGERTDLSAEEPERFAELKKRLHAVRREMQDDPTRTPCR